MIVHHHLLTGLALLLLRFCCLLQFGEANGVDSNPDGRREAGMACDPLGYTFDVIIVGAGMAGLATANTLRDLSPGLCIKILEKRSEVGGRMKTTVFAENYKVEEGANWINGGNGQNSKQPIREMADKYNVPHFDMWLGTYCCICWRDSFDCTRLGLF